MLAGYRDVSDLGHHYYAGTGPPGAPAPLHLMSWAGEDWDNRPYFSAYEQLSADEVREIWLSEGEARKICDTLPA